MLYNTDIFIIIESILIVSYASSFGCAYKYVIQDGRLEPLLCQFSLQEPYILTFKNVLSKISMIFKVIIS